MPKRKLEDFSDDSQFRFWGIVISRFVWGYSRSVVAAKFGCKEPYITKVMNKFESDGGCVDHRQFNQGGHRKVTEEFKETLAEAILKTPNISSPQLHDEMLEEGYDIHERTIRKVRKLIGFSQIKPSLLPQLSESTMQQRREYCIRHLKDKFSNTCFSDESNFQLAANRQVLWYRKGEDEKPHLPKPRNNKKVMIWGGISRKGQTQLHVYRLDEGTKVNKEAYVDCLDQHLVDYMDAKFGRSKWRFMHDNARPHIAGYTSDFLDGNGVSVLEHPPYSPDLNPIEKVWAWMKAEICQTTYDDVEDLIEAVKNKWDSMTRVMQNNLIDNHMKVIQKVHAANGVYV